MKRSLSAGHTPRLPIRGVPLVRTQLAKTTERLFLNVPPFVSNFMYDTAFGTSSSRSRQVPVLPAQCLFIRLIDNSDGWP